MAAGKQDTKVPYEGILELWCDDTYPKQHYTKDPEFDALIKTKIADLAQSHTSSWWLKGRFQKHNTMSYEDILKFWFDGIIPEQHYVKDPEFEASIKTKMWDVYQSAKSGELVSWRNTPGGSLAEIIILDQFSRYLFRDTDQAFESDLLALQLAREAIAKGFDKQLKTEHKGFLYMPFMHSESKEMHEEAAKLFNIEGLQAKHKIVLERRTIIDQFGRYPHRNQLLGRESTAEEMAYLTHMQSESGYRKQTVPQSPNSSK